MRIRFSIPGPSLWALLLLLILSTAAQAGPQTCGAELDLKGPHGDRLYDFAKGMGLRYPRAFVNIINHLESTGRLPDCFLSKREAQDRGWGPGRSLWRYAPGHSIGGSRFGNYERRLPGSYDGRYREADIDYDGRRRGASRLVFVPNSKGKGLIWLTVDHYNQFHRIPKP
ncbi:MAG: hypothetical protein KDH88_05505 [Chromatiales bacterium]|nr:hypothetical protein [Chromatiales bacterium]